ncbi:MAG TPA: hypothetical protein VF595_12675 [Tepidisphaeraceae bacterium]|jgi:hypothetical protein
MSRSPTPSPADSRTARSDDRGSVLIFVVGVLLLLAIVATAFLGTSRADRTSTQQNAYNTQIDLLLEGVVNTMKGSILSDARINVGADSIDSLESDSFLAGRVPSLFNPVPLTTTTATAGNPPLWSHITGPQLDSNFSYPMPPGRLTFDTAGYNVAPPATYKTRRGVVPTYVRFKGQPLPAFFINASDEVGSFPETAYTTTPNQVPVPAIDADGDGIADSGMVRLPIGSLAGVTYYYGARVVDLSSAMNANTAWSWDSGVAAGRTPGNFFPSNVDLFNATSGNATQRNDQFIRNRTGLNAVRLGQTADASAPTFSASVADDNQNARAEYTFSTGFELLWLQSGRRLGNPGYLFRSATTEPRQLGKFDINNTATLARNFVLKDAAGTKSKMETALAQALQGTQSDLNTLPATTDIVVKDSAWAADKPAENQTNWFNYTFAFPRGNPASQTMPLRSILTGTNPVGIDTPLAPISVPAAGANARFGDTVLISGRRFLCIAPETTTTPDTLAGLADWTTLSWVNQPRKANLNTADFGELMWNFRRFMSLTDNDVDTQPAPKFAAGSPFPINPTGNTSLSVPDRARWRQYRNVIRDPYALDPAITWSARTDLPTSGGRFMTSSEVLQLRSALAAVNTLDLRDDDDNITARRIQTAVYPATPGDPIYPRHAVTVFGTERQPYLTEVYVNNDITPGPGSAGVNGPNLKGYVAIEFYNPYPVPLNLNGWTLGVINRRRGTTAAPPPNAAKTPGPGTPLTIDPLLPVTARTFDATMVIPANGFLVLENFNDLGNRIPDATVPSADDAVHRPTRALLPGTAASPTMRLKFISNLHRVLYDAGVGAVPGQPNGGELVLLRPRVCNIVTGVPAYTTNLAEPTDPHDEGTAAAPNLHDLVPIDSFDFTNMNVAAAGPFNVWHYFRENGAGTSSWRWAIAGPYNVTAGVAATPPTPTPTPQTPQIPQPTHRQGPPAAPFNAGDPEPATPGGAVALGAADGPGLPLVNFQGPQLNNVDWPSRREIVPNPGGVKIFPAGGFARETDVFMIPTIGAYKILTLTSPAVTTPDGMALPETTADVTDPTLAAEAPNFTEMNAVALDHSFVDDEDTNVVSAVRPPPGSVVVTPNPTTNDAFEQVGRLCPLHTFNPLAFVDYPYTVARPTGAAAPDPAKGETRTVTPVASQVDWYDPNFNFKEGSAVTTGTRSIFDYFTRESHNNTLPDVGADAYISLYTAAPEQMPMNSSPNSEIKPANMTYMVAGAGSNGTTLVCRTNVPYAVDFTGCAVQALTGAARGLIGTVTNGKSPTATPPYTAPHTTMTITGLAGLAAGDVVRILAVPETPVVNQGLININTAPWYVLARLPWIINPAASANPGAVNPEASSDMAKLIVQYRDGNPIGGTPYERKAHGPFRSILDLNRFIINQGGMDILLFQRAYIYNNPTSTPTIDLVNPNADRGLGDITPVFDLNGADRTPDAVPGDFESRYMALSRVCNLITTRSDAFVVYIQLQGWRDAGTANATMVTQRRAAFLIDRSGATTAAPTLQSTRVPVN